MIARQLSNRILTKSAISTIQGAPVRKLTPGQWSNIWLASKIKCVLLGGYVLHLLNEQATRQFPEYMRA